ncbi:MAG: SNF2 helicase-associated domain-containing protein, partial [Gaiellales bacterium]
MLALHPALSADGVLHIWGTSGSEDEQPVEHDQLLKALQQLNVGARTAPTHADLRLPDGPTKVEALQLSDLAMLELLEVARDDGAPLVPGIVGDAALQVLARLRRTAGALVVRQELVPEARWQRDADGNILGLQACWTPLPSVAIRPQIDAIARALPPSALAMQIPKLGRVQLTDHVLARLVDALVRARLAGRAPAPAHIGAANIHTDNLHDRWLLALGSEDPLITGPSAALDSLLEEIGRWQLRLRRPTTSPFRVCFRLEEPDDPGDDADDGDPWRLRALLQVRDDPTLLIDVADTWKPTGNERQLLRSLEFRSGEHVLAPLGEAAQLFEPIAEELRRARPGTCDLTTEQAHDFLAQAAPLLEQSGFGVFVPAWWRGADGTRARLTLHAHVSDGFSGGRRMLDSLNLETLVEYDWRAAI